MFSFPVFAAPPAPQGRLLTAMAVLACCLSAPALGARHATPFGDFAGEWRGGGKVSTSDGNAETIACKARYDVTAGGAQFTQSLVCASPSYRFDIQSHVSAQGDGVTGDWQETTRNIGGALRGQVADGDFEGSVDGPGFTASISLRSNGHRQAVVIRPQGQSISEVSVTLKRTGAASSS